MFIFSKAFPLLEKGYRIRHKRWPDLYFIMLKENKVYDSSDNLYIEDFQDYVAKNSEVSDAAGHIWEIYYEIADENL
jgi:hypothetical protein